MKKYIIERQIPSIGAFTNSEFQTAAQTSNDALSKLNGRAQWIESFVADNQTFCVYLAENEEAIMEHSKLSGFPANKITEIKVMIDPTTAN